MVCAPIVTSGSSAKDFSSSQDMQSSRAIAASSTPCTLAQRRNLAPDIMFARQRPQPVVQAVEGGLLGGRRGGIEARRGAADLDLDRGCLGDHPLQRDPPQPPGAFGEIAGDIDGAGRVKFAHHRQRVVAVVAIAVVEREAGKAPREIALDEPLVHFVHGDDVDVACAQMRQHRAQEFGLDLEVMIGLEFGVAARADVVQHENGADARENRPQQVMRAGEVKRFQAGADNGGTELLHQGWLTGWIPFRR